MKICFYMRRSKYEIAREVMRSFEIYLHAVGPQALAWYNDHQGDWGYLDTTSWQTFRRDLLASNWSHHELTHDPSGAPSFHFTYSCQSLGQLFEPNPPLVSSVGFCFPTEFLEEQGPGHVRELALELAAALPYDSGHAGLFFNSILGYRETEEALSRFCLRYPGMDIGDVESIAEGLNGRVKGPSWLTFLGQPVLGELGGVEGLRARLSSPGTTVEPLEGDRAVITLGTWPEAGDTEAGHNLPEYRELARVLEPWLYHSGGGYYFPQDIWQRWERRFLD
ncbi:hypothetical protein DB31_7935 [Hyalangium minutum]|uniref:DUF3396 domain-containing protein n=1 Tax=Hyalangium minutum TaxID=394096 RepID=A0A085WLY5_9BACT|nr:hypothetical protein DB31_7935 [Hyalangium minutum]